MIQVVVQVPTPPIPPEIATMPMFMSGDDIAKIVAASLLGVAIIVYIVARGPIGQAIGEAIRRKFGFGHAALSAESEALAARLDQMQHQLAELGERQDFAERLLAQVRREKALPGAGDVRG